MHDPSHLSTPVAAEPDDASVIANSRHDPEWFSVIFDRYFTAIHRYAAARLGPAAADDVAAETFLAGFDQRDRYDLTRPEAKAWLYGIATNLIGRHRRDELRLYRALSRAAGRDDTENHADRVTDRVTAEQLSPRLARGLKSLPQGDRDALMLVACAGLSYAEAAFALGVPIGTVSSRLNRARARLRKSLGHAVKEV
ncbi:RNA polymerase sigma factor [Nonomuraea gerenzanensis]|uniref:RNA polymerase ECF-subfamily sigma factor n=1 Tax=Nonomuraea gerenzanensis TaxID=93944 RepID=A0A1M4EAY1_9ACTN|nr:RNA polymerase sigma factor [Nonomuraea gerenzanensis]UBU18144.1 RNA polymerase sigma factor [Nonomuraea gerenzanensis]SBO95954.1 RNA polymerase ECF-subfamily sigma factor [Nonomuraea gerenzanensis]